MKKGKYDAMTIAKYIISYCYEHGIMCNMLKLQRLMYFIQAQFLVNTEEKRPCFHDPIIAVDHGVMIYSVQEEFGMFGGCDIPCLFEPKYYTLPISGEDMEEINVVLTMLKDYSATDLMRIILGQSPWKKTYVQNKHRVITNQSIMEFFNTYG